jgi:hypothetical protein
MAKNFMILLQILLEYTNLSGNPQYADTLNKMRTILAEGWTASLPPVYQLQPFYRDA